ncbi:MAG TPA: ATP-dependent helicase HrpB [Polyangiaceae bacterium]|nr:ATP-dependent helicase HrpB [Polyangiaceae bacterium]
MSANAPETLPVDELLGPLAEALRTAQAVVVEAPPGAGKTTRVPRALLDAGFARSGEIWVTEPRRVAARLAASFVARQLGEAVGERVGYSVRFEDRSSAATRVRYVTEGVLLERLVAGGADGAPARGLSVVVLDEFHERHLATDLNLMLLRRELARQPGLRLIVMSATLDAEAVARHLGGCPRLRCSGRLYPLTITHDPPTEDERPLHSRVSSAVKKLVRESPRGDLLVFLPGAGEIQRAEEALAGFAGEQQLSLAVLHGEMPLDAQVRAITPGERRKVVLATNVAESSITVEGVTAVIDSGLARIAEHSPWTGRQSLVVRPIARSSALQRAGRAGRTAPGQVLRLYTKASLDSRPEQEKPELQRLDLAGPLLSLYGAGLDPEASDWLDAPPDAALDSARALLERLGLLRGKRLTELGEQARSLPLHPRLARLALEGARTHNAATTTLAAALLAERDIRQHREAGARELGLVGCECDVDQLIELYRQAEQERFSARSLRQLGLHAGRVDTVRQSQRQLWNALRPPRGKRGEPGSEPEDARRALGLALLSAFPDRVARRREPGGRELILASGHSAQLDEQSVARNSRLLIAVEAEERSYVNERAPRAAPRASLRVRLASPLEAEWLLDHAAEGLSEKQELSWDDAKERAVLTSQLCWGAVVLEQSQRPAPAGGETTDLVERAALAQLATLFGKHDTLPSLMARSELLSQHLPALGFDRVQALGTRGLLRRACETTNNLEQLRALDWQAFFLEQLTPEQQRQLEREAPEWIQLRGGRRVRVQYVAGQPPWIESRLQDFFGMQAGPSVCSGRVPLTLHLLAPNQRAVQVTADLAGFWERHYPSIRRELQRRYPKHAWPEDGRVAPGKA